MSVTLEIPQAEVSEWLAVLKPYQRSTIEFFLQNSSVEEAAEKWLSSTGSPNIVPFGGSANTKPFWDRFIGEFKKFICDDDAYIEEKTALKGEGPVSKALMVSVVSAAIGANIGYAATLLAPAVALMLCTVGKMTKNAYCNNDG